MENDAGEFVDLYCPRKWWVKHVYKLMAVRYNLLWFLYKICINFSDVSLVSPTLQVTINMGTGAKTRQPNLNGETIQWRRTTRHILLCVLI